MTDAGFFRGTSADQDNRFANKQKKLLKEMNFSPILNTNLNTSKLDITALKPWIEDKIKEILETDDELLSESIYEHLAGKEPDGKDLLVLIAGFVDDTKATKFMEELWTKLIDVQDSTNGKPADSDRSNSEPKLKETNAEVKKEEDEDKSKSPAKADEDEEKRSTSRPKSRSRSSRSSTKSRSISKSPRSRSPYSTSFCGRISRRRSRSPRGRRDYGTSGYRGSFRGDPYRGGFHDRRPPIRRRSPWGRRRFSPRSPLRRRRSPSISPRRRRSPSPYSSRRSRSPHHLGPMMSRNMPSPRMFSHITPSYGHSSMSDRRHIPLTRHDMHRPMMPVGRSPVRIHHRGYGGDSQLLPSRHSPGPMMNKLPDMPMGTLAPAPRAPGSPPYSSPSSSGKTKKHKKEKKHRKHKKSKKRREASSSPERKKKHHRKHKKTKKHKSH